MDMITLSSYASDYSLPLRDCKEKIPIKVKKDVAICIIVLHINRVMKMAAKDIIVFAEGRVNARLRAWSSPAPGHIDYEADEFKQQATVDLWLALEQRPALKKRGMVSVVRRSMVNLLRQRLGPKGHKRMIRMSTEDLDRFHAREVENPYIICETFDYISTRLGNQTGLILECFKRGASIVDVIDALQMSVSAFYVRLNRIRGILEN